MKTYIDLKNSITKRINDEITVRKNALKNKKNNFFDFATPDHAEIKQSCENLLLKIATIDKKIVELKIISNKEKILYFIQEIFYFILDVQKIDLDIFFAMIKILMNSMDIKVTANRQTLDHFKSRYEVTSLCQDIIREKLLSNPFEKPDEVELKELQETLETASNDLAEDTPVNPMARHAAF